LGQSPSFTKGPARGLIGGMLECKRKEAFGGGKAEGVAVLCQKEKQKEMETKCPVKCTRWSQQMKTQKRERGGEEERKRDRGKGEKRGRPSDPGRKGVCPYKKHSGGTKAQEGKERKRQLRQKENHLRGKSPSSPPWARNPERKPKGKNSSTAKPEGTPHLNFCKRKAECIHSRPGQKLPPTRRITLTAARAPSLKKKENIIQRGEGGANVARRRMGTVGEVVKRTRGNVCN